MSTKPGRWYHGARGEWYVVIQGLLFALVLFGPQQLPGLPTWPLQAALPWRTLGALLLIAGGLIATLAALHLGSNLTPLPHPRSGGALVRSGLYRWVRHPIYLGVLAMALGWAVFVQSLASLGYCIVLALFLDIKSRREERWLVAHYPGYQAYQREVAKLLPFIY